MPARGSRLPAVVVATLAVALVVLVVLLARSLSFPEEVADTAAAAAPRDAAAREPVAQPLEQEQAGHAAGPLHQVESTEARGEAVRKVGTKPAARAPTRLVGRVVDDAGEPLSGALLLLGQPAAPWPLDAPGPEGRAEPARTRTSAEGRFSFEPVPTGTFALAVRLDGFAPLDVEPLTLAGASLDMGELALGPSPVLRGRVVDPQGRPVADARLVSLPDLLPGAPDALNERNGALVASADALGQFEVRALRPGDWRLLVSSARHPERVFEGRADPADGPLEGLVFQLAPGAVLPGRIMGADIAAEEPLLVHAAPLHQLEGGAPETLAGFRRVRVDEWGTFELTGLVPGQVYGLRVLKPGQATRSEDAFSDWTPARAGGAEVELTYAPSAIVSFTVQNRYDGSAIERFRFELGGAWPATLRDPSGAEVERHPNGRVELRVRPGRLVQDPVFADVLQGSGVSLRVAAEGHELFELLDLTLTSGQRTELGSLRLTPLPTLDVRVVDDASGEPVGGASVVCAGSMAETDADGLATVFFPLSDMAAVRAVMGLTAAEADVPMAATKTAEPFELRLAPGPAPGAIAVAVTDMGGNPLRRHMVCRTTPPGSEEDLEWLPVDAAGRVTFAVEPGTHGVRAVASPRLGRLQQPPVFWQPVAVRAGEETEVSIFGQRLEAVVGRLMLGGLPVADARLRLNAGLGSQVDVGAEWSEAVGLEARTDSDGRFRFEDVAPGWYSLLIDHPASGVRTRASLEADSFERVIDLDATPVLGKVFDESGVPVAGARVSAYSEARRPRVYPEVALGTPVVRLAPRAVPFAVTTADRFGRFAFSAFPAGVRCSIVAEAGEQSGARWGVRAADGAARELDVVLQPTASLDVRVEAPEQQRVGVLLSSPYRPEGFAAAFALPDSDGVAHFAGLAEGEWQAALLALDALDRVDRGGQWSDLELEAGAHHELALELPLKR